MPTLDHTIVTALDHHGSAAFVADVLGLPPPVTLGHFAVVRVGEVTTLGIPVGAAVIVGAWALTGTYVVWANRHYDPEVERLRRRLRPN